MTEQAQAVLLMQQYIAAHLEEEISLSTLAKLSGFSPWYAYRLFARYTGHTPANYIRKLRLSESALRLRDEHVTVTEIAFALGFQSVDGYQRAFLKEFGCNPGRYVKHPVPLYLFTPYGIYEREEKEETVMENIKNIFLQIIEKPARKVIIKRAKNADNYWDYSEEVGCDVWGLLKSMKSLCGEPVCLWLPQAYRNGGSEYVQGVEVGLDETVQVPEGFELLELPAAQYLMFQGEPFEEKDFEEAIGQIWKAIEEYDPSVIGYAWDLENPRIQLEPIGERGYIELKAVKKLQK